MKFKCFHPKANIMNRHFGIDLRLIFLSLGVGALVFYLGSVCIAFDGYAYTGTLMWKPGTYSYLQDSALDSSGRFYVVDGLFHRVFVFRL